MMENSFLHRSVGQIGYVVKDIYRTMDYYIEHHGITGWHVYTYGSPLLRFMRYHGKDIEYSAHIALNYFGNTRIELIQNLEGKTLYTDFIETHGYGLHHLGVYVEDIQKELEAARLEGIEISMEGGGFGLDGDGHFAYLDTQDTAGAIYELIERPKRRADPEAIYP